MTSPLERWQIGADAGENTELMQPEVLLAGRWLGVRG